MMILRGWDETCPECGGVPRGCFGCAGMGYRPARDIRLQFDSLSGEESHRFSVFRMTVGVPL